MANFLQETNPVMHWKLMSHRPLDRIVIHAQLDAWKEPYSHFLFPLCHFLSHQYLQFLWVHVRLLGHPSLFCYAEEIGSLQVILTTVTQTTSTLKHWNLGYY